MTHYTRAVINTCLFGMLILGLPVLFAGLARFMVRDEWFDGLLYAAEGLLMQLLAAVLILVSLTVNPIIRLATATSRKRRTRLG